MGRDNKIFKSAINNVISNNDIQKFKDNDTNLGITVTPELRYLKNLYNEMINPIIPLLENLSKMEELIIQVRSRECISKDIKVTIQREYVYARTSFYRDGKEGKDIRAIIGKTDVYGTDVDEIVKNPQFIERATKVLYDVMSAEIEKNNKQFIPNFHEV